MTQIQPEMMDAHSQIVWIWGGLEMCWPLGGNQWRWGQPCIWGGDEVGPLRVEGRSSASRDSLTHLGKALENTGLFIIKSAKKIEWLRFRPWLGIGRGLWEPQRRCFLKPQEKGMQEVGHHAVSKAGSYPLDKAG